MNPDAVQNGTEKPNLAQKGPYTYKCVCFWILYILTYSEI
jgi:hypothetical protein